MTNELLDVRAQNGLGFLYELRQSYTEAFKWYRLAAEKGNDNAQYSLGVLYANCQGVKQSDSEAFKWFRKSADQGNIYALQSIGLAYMDGKGVRQSYSKAKEYFGLACDKGDDLSCGWYAKLNKKGY